jgi:hypothetical protein
MRRIFRWLAIPLIAAVSVSPVLVEGDNSEAAPLSNAANAAFGDVSRCLTTGKSKKLDVFYLIDNSGSLEWTDPKNLRQEILKSSVAQLGSFAEQGVEVRTAASLFSTDAEMVLDWTPIETPTSAQQAAEQVGSFITNKIIGGATNWEAGLQLAFEEMTSRESSCKMLIWFTDGGINPDDSMEGKLTSLSNLCRPGIALDSLGKPGKFGLMSQFRAAQIPVFGVLYNNLEAAEKHYQQKGVDAVSQIAEDLWSMSFMRALVEGRSDISSLDFFGQRALGGRLDCARLDSQGIAPVEEVNGALLDAEDPVALAYQFLKLAAQIKGGAGSAIIDGKFSVPPGTAKFGLIVNGSEWALAGPEAAEIAANSSTPHPSVTSQNSVGATALEVVVAGNPEAVGEWQLDSFGKDAELFLYPGLTFALDRDANSKILSGYPNTLTGRIVRTAEFEAYPIDFESFEDLDVSLSYLKNGARTPFVDAEVQLEPSGEFAVTNLQPEEGTEILELWLTLGLGANFNPVESKFVLEVEDKSAIVSASTDNLMLSSLIGPDGVAQGSLVLQGPNSTDESTFCFAEVTRLQDTQTGIEKVSRDSGFEWTFIDSNSGKKDSCFTVGQGATLEIQVEARNSTQADSEVVAVWNITAESPSVGVKFEAPLKISFDTQTQSNQAVTWVVFALLLLLGVGLPLILLWIMNFVTTRFLPIEGMTKLSIPVLIENSSTGIRILDDRRSPASAIVLDPKDFVNVSPENGPKSFQTGAGIAQARVPMNPLGSSWYEWQAPPQSRVVTSYLGASKRGKAFDHGLAAEISPNLKEDWAITIADKELEKPAGEPLKATLTVFAPMLSLAGYQDRLARIASSNGMQGQIKKLRDYVLASKKVETKDTKPEVANPITGTAVPLPPGLKPPTAGVPLPPTLPGINPPNIPGGGKPPGPPPIK